MAYASTEYEFWGNPKVRAAGKDAALLYIAANGHCNQFMTDGFISEKSIETIASLAFQRSPKKAIDALVENNLWHRVDGGYEVHDYLKHNKSKAQIESLTEKRSTAGKAGADTRYKPNGEANAMANAMTKSIERAKQAPCDLPCDTSISISKDLKDSTTTATRAEGGIAEISKTYESEIGFLTGSIRDELVLMEGEYPAEWIREAIKEAAKVNKRSLKYTQGILKRWKVEGFKSDTRIREKGGNGYRRENIRTKPDMGGYKVDRSNEIVVIEDGYEPEGGGK